MRACGLDLDYANEFLGSVGISNRDKRESHCIMSYKYRGVFRADEHIVMAQKRGCRFYCRDSGLWKRPLTRLIFYRWRTNEGEDDRSSQIRSGQGKAELLIEQETIRTSFTSRWLRSWTMYSDLIGGNTSTLRPNYLRVNRTKTKTTTDDGYQYNKTKNRKKIHFLNLFCDC